MHRQLYDFLRRAVIQGQLAAGARLPSTRALAHKLGVSRNTVLNAYEALAMEGYLAGKVGSGTRVRRISDPVANVLYPRTLDTRRILRESHYPVEARSFYDPDGNLIYVHR
jgi:DNA-binding GntR family transcriptional regulator